MTSALDLVGQRVYQPLGPINRNNTICDLTMQKIRRKVAENNYSKLALSMVLPHENKPIRFPVVPAVHTALLDTMADGTVPIADGQSKRAFLCRDPCFPLWMERSCNAVGAFLESVQGSVQTWTIPNRANNVLMTPAWNRLNGVVGTVPTVDSVLVTAAGMADYAVMASINGEAQQALFIPPNSTFHVRIYTGAVGGGSGLELEFAYQVGGEVFMSTVLAISTSTGFEMSAIAGETLPVGSGMGTTPYGFVWLRAWRTTQTAPTLATSPFLQYGWVTGGTFATPTSTRTFFLPFQMPPEFNNSVLPYNRSRLNASAALFTNVTAALSKEGTILAARLKPAIVDPWAFTTGTVNSVHPSLRYFGPLEKGLYTFTTPGGNVEAFTDNVITIGSNSVTNATSRPLFNYDDIGIYNAIIFSDLGSASAGTQLAVSQYAHIEFETTSSLFAIGVSSQPMELLHSTEVALLKFGHFHENPIHWSVLAAAVKQAVKFLAPIAAPYVQQFANYAVRRGTEYLTGKTAGDRAMTQKTLNEPRQQRSRSAKSRKANRRARVPRKK